MINSLFRRLKYKDNSDSSRKNIKKFLDHELECLKIYYLLITICEERIKVNFGGIKYRGKAFVNTEEGEDNSESFKSPKNDFSINRDGNYSFIRILNLELKYSEKY